MAKKGQLTKVGKRNIELTNLDKVLYPEDGIVKAQVIEYYLKIAPTILRHIKKRPLSLIRYPDGIHEEQFFQKNRPDWAPEWIESVLLGEKKKDYIMATEEASMVWLANLACLEIHQMHTHGPKFENPDYMVFDLDPPEGTPFEQIIEVAFDLKDHLEQFGYHTFVKTSGGKGVHVWVPLQQKWSFEKVFEAISALAKPFVQKHSKELTLAIKKEARKGKILVDIYRNHASQTIISPYSIRGREKAPVSMPMPWEQLENLKDPTEFNINTALAQVLETGDAWEAIAAYAMPLHTERPKLKKKSLPKSGKRKTPEQLESYRQKRDFSKTPEPGPGLEGGRGDAFVLHRHHARNLHYDLRLEQDGTLKSWAVPKGLPPRPGIKRLAVQTEDHPLEYLNFDGKIPKGEYGGGMMWIYANGRYEITKQKKDGFYFALHAPNMSGEYRMHNTKGKEWLLERVDHPQIDYINEEIRPMLAEIQRTPPKNEEDYEFEVKWDGIRALISLDEGEIRIRSRSMRDITAQFPELNIPDQAFRATAGVFDGEIVCLKEGGQPSFPDVINRLHHTNESRIERASRSKPAYCYLFDCLYLDGRSLVNDPLVKRREFLKDAIKDDTAYRFSESVAEGAALFEASRKLGLEGIMAKEKTGKYLPGKRSSNWLKIKIRNTVDVLIIGFTEGKGDRQPYFGAMHIAARQEDELSYLGKVGTGFDNKTFETISEQLRTMPVIKRPIKKKPPDDAQSTWIEPILYCEVEYASITGNGTLREPVFLRLRPDLSEEKA